MFPISLLSRAAVTNGRVELGRCIDAMAGCSSGQLSYVVVSEGGVAGVGETLRRLPWAGAKVDGEAVIVRVDASDFGRLDELPRDQWPGR
jgi:hypothetical protein